LIKVDLFEEKKSNPKTVLAYGSNE